MNNLCRQNEGLYDVTLAGVGNPILWYEEVWWRAIIWGGSLSREEEAKSTSQLGKADTLHFCNSILADPGEIIEKCVNSLVVFHFRYTVNYCHSWVKPEFLKVTGMQACVCVKNLKLQRKFDFLYCESEKNITFSVFFSFFSIF